MPQIFSIHYFPITNNNEISIYDYSQGTFLTVSDKVADKIPENAYKNVLSCGAHKGIYSKKVCLDIMEKLIMKKLNVNTNHVAIIETFDAKDNDYYCTYSGPPDMDIEEKMWIYGYEKTEDGEKLVQKKIEKETYKLFDIDVTKSDLFTK